MIGYLISRPQLQALIAQHSPQWLARAAAHTANFAAQGGYIKHSPIWSEIKAVYFELQGRAKCAYCERKFENAPIGNIELVVEHFRPKSKVKRWRLSKELQRVGIMLTNVPEPNGGYYLLAYEILNYCAACDLCNTTLKGNYFPIAGAYNFAAGTAAALAAEQPLLLFPLVDDPEQFVDFYGVSPRPVSQQAQIRDRALVTIEFFKLDDVNSRKHLVRERAQLITGLFPQLETMCGAGPPLDKQIASDLVFSYLASRSPHANCIRSFVLLFFSAPQEARDIYELTAHFVATTS